MSTGAGWAPVQGACPSVALLASRGTDDLVASKGFLSVSQLLAPFTTTSVNVRDPSTGLAVSNKITLDIRDMKKDGYLLTHTVLPHVLHEALQSPDGNWSVDSSLKCFNDTLAQWVEPVDQETFRSYLSCLFFVSTRDENPLASLSQLIQMQHSQQHSSDGISLGPSHCAKPVWTTPTTLKHYVIVYESHDEQRSREIFSQMCSTYGIESCSQLRLETVRTSENGDDGIPSTDPWFRRLPSYRILDSGLERARLSLIEKANAAAAAFVGDASPSSPSMGITTIASSYSISSAASGSPSTVLPPQITRMTPSSSFPPLDPLSSSSPPLSPDGRWTGENSRRVTTQADKEACSHLIEDYAKNNLIPHVERLMRTLNESLANRRGISRSLASGMKKWFGGGGVSGGSGNSGEKGGTGGSVVTYAAESPQMQMRRLADLAFLFGLYAFAHSQYQAVKKEFAADNAWLHHALALEMSASSLHLAHPQLTAAQFRCHYVENSIGGLLQNGARWPSLLRAGLHAWRIYSHLGMHTAAAAQLVRLTTIENDSCVGLALWLAAESFSEAKMRRKAAFYRFLAAHRWSKGGQVQLQLAAYAAAFPEYVGKRWSLAEDRLALELSSWSADGRVAIGAAERLITPRERSELETEANLAHYGRVRARHAGTKVDESAARSIPVPVVEMGETRVIAGERPLSGDVVQGGGGRGREEEEKWRSMERASFHAVAGTSTAFRPTHIVSDADTDNTRVRETPSGERYRVQLRIRNPLSIPLQLRDAHLGVSDVKRREGVNGHSGHSDANNDEGIKVHHMDNLVLPANDSRMVEFSLTPSSSISEFRVSSLRFQLTCAPGVMANGEIGLEIRGRRLNGTSAQMKSVVYAVDERLHAIVSPRAWPLCDVKCTRNIPTVLYTDQLVTLHVDVVNSGSERVEGVAMAVDAVDRVVVEEGVEGGEKADEHPAYGSSHDLRLSIPPLDLASTPGVRAFALRGGTNGGKMERGERRRVVIQLRAPALPSSSHIFSLLLLYRGVGGATREWRTRIDTRVAQLLHVTTRVLDPYHGLVALCMRNALTSHDAALARVEVTRVRVAVASRQRGAVLMQAESGLAAVRSAGEGISNVIRLESGQSQEVCMRISAPEMEGEGEEWRLAEGEKPPEWPLPVDEDDPERIEWGKRRLLVGVAWKANVVGNDGLVHSLLGESFLPDPFVTAGMHVAGLHLGFSLATPGGVASPIPSSDDVYDEENGGPPVFLSAQPLQPVEHDFSRNSLCQFPITLIVRNECARGRMAEIELRMKPKVREPSIPPPRQQWWISKECVRSRVEARGTGEMKVKVRVTQPSAYDLLGAQMTCAVRMEGDEKWRNLRVPPLMAVVYAAYGGEHA